MANIFETLKASGLMDLDSKIASKSQPVEKVVVDGIEYYQCRYTGFWTDSANFYFDAKGKPKYSKAGVKRWEYYYKKVLPALMRMSRNAYADGDTEKGQEYDQQYTELMAKKNYDKTLYADLLGTDGLMTREQLDKLAKKAAK